MHNISHGTWTLKLNSKYFKEMKIHITERKFASKEVISLLSSIKVINALIKISKKITSRRSDEVDRNWFDDSWVSKRI